MKTGPFIDGRTITARHVPGTTEIPSETVITKRAKPGVFVKLGYEDDFFWIQVNSNDPHNQTLTGVVITSPPGDNSKLRMRDPVRFSYKNVLDILASGG